MSAAEYRKIIAVDFDGTLAVTQFPTIIEPKWNEIAICKALKKQGCILILWTCRCGDLLEEAVAWCRMFGLEFDAVNENVAQTLEQYGTESRKISADVYIDDKACWPWMTKQEWERYLAG